MCDTRDGRGRPTSIVGRPRRVSRPGRQARFRFRHQPATPVALTQASITWAGSGTGVNVTWIWLPLSVAENGPAKLPTGLKNGVKSLPTIPTGGVMGFAKSAIV